MLRVRQAHPLVEKLSLGRTAPLCAALTQVAAGEPPE